MVVAAAAIPAAVVAAGPRSGLLVGPPAVAPEAVARPVATDQVIDLNFLILNLLYILKLVSI